MGWAEGQQAKTSAGRVSPGLWRNRKAARRQPGLSQQAEHRKGVDGNKKSHEKMFTFYFYFIDNSFFNNEIFYKAKQIV